MQKGTLFQLHNLINRPNISKVKANVDGGEDFMDIITRGHILAAALEHFGMSSVDDIPQSTKVDINTWSLEDEERKILLEVSMDIVNKYVDLDTIFKENLSWLKRKVL